ncbi:MAG: LCP family protein [Eubacterium sp.]|nr:LCP family protein [Eubacterium sp.]
MKKPIDPNLSNTGDSDLLEITGASQPGEEFNIVTKEEAPARVAAPSASGNESTEHHHSHSSDGSHSSHHHHHHHHHHHSSHSSSSKSSHGHSRRKKKSKLPVTAKIAIGIIIAILLALSVAVVGFFVYREMGKKDVMTDVSGTAYHETVEYKGHTYRFNPDVVALGFLGVDQRKLETVDETDFVGAADADIVVTVDIKTGKTKVIAIPRDTMIDIDIYSPDSGVLLNSQSAQLCLAYSYGDGGVKSCESTIDAMSRILYNVPIQKYYALDLDGIAPLNDAIGGVKINNSLYPFPEMGVKVGDEVTLKGDMAEAYVRTRSMDDVEASLNRTQRQVQYVKAYAAQALPAVLSNFSTIPNLYNTAVPYSNTNLTLSNATFIGSLLLQKGVTDFETYTIEGEMKAAKDPLKPGIVHAEFYPDEDSVMETVLSVFYTKID